MGRPSDALYRALAFEQLETKRSPAALLLAVASADEDTHAAVEETIPERNVDVSCHWRQTHSAEQLLHFVEQQAGPGSSRPWTTPRASECSSADEMMKLQDDALKSILVSKSVQPSRVEM